MGVVHKLTQEIIDFILSQKKENPSLSCRSMTRLVSERFGMDVSKSSINNLLKEERLSSPVGRRSASLRTNKKQFKIPEIKRSQIQLDLASSFVQQSAIDEPEEKNKAEKQTDFLDGAGVIFLRAAECDLTRGPVLGEILDCGDEEERAFIKILSLLHGFNLDSFEKIRQYSGKGMWRLANFHQMGERSFAQWLEKGKDWKQALLKFSVKSPAFFTKVSYFKLYLEDKNVLYLDAQAGAVWSENVQSGLYASLAQSTEVLARQILSNVQSVVLCGMCPKKQGQKTTSALYFQNFIESFEGIHGKKIVAIGLIDEQDRELAQFKSDLNIRREFIAGVWPWQIEFQALMDSKREIATGKVAMSDLTSEIHFKEIKASNLFGDGATFKMLRGFLLYEPFNNIPFAGLLSNLDPQQEAQRVVSAYLRRWPYLTQGAVYQRISSGEAKILPGSDRGGTDALWEGLTEKGEAFSAFDLTRSVGEMLNRYVQCRFFPAQYHEADFYTMHNRFYRLSGSLVENKQEYCVVLDVSSENLAYKEDLVFAARAVNEASIQMSHHKPIKILLK